MTVFKFCLNVALYTMWMVTLLKVLKRRFSMPITIIGSILIFLIWFGSIFLAPLGSTFVHFTAIFVFSGWYILFKDNPGRVIAAMFANFVSMLLVEMVLALFCPEFAQAAAHPEVLTSPQVMLASILYLPANALLLCMVVKIMNRRRAVVMDREWIPMLMLLAGQWCIQLIFAQLYIRGNLPGSFPILFLLFFAFVLSYLIFLYIIWSISARSLLESRRELLDRQLAHQTAHYAALTEQYEAVRHMRHDIANHMHTIRILLKEGQREQAAAYARELEESYAKSLGRDEGEKQAEIPSGTR